MFLIQNESVYCWLICCLLCCALYTTLKVVRRAGPLALSLGIVLTLDWYSVSVTFAKFVAFTTAFNETHSIVSNAL